MTTALLAIALSVPAVAMAQSTTQDNSAQSTSQQDSMQTSQSNTQADQAKQNQAAETQMNGMNTSPHQTMTGMVSADGKTFTTSDNKVYQVSNPGSLKDYANQNVTVKAQFNTDSNSIKINKVNPSK
jgi:hypothetical protein